MGMPPETIATDARSRDGPPRRAEGPAVPVPRVWWWVLPILLGLVSAAVDVLIVVVATRERTPAAADASHRDPGGVEGSPSGTGSDAEPATVAVAAATDPSSSCRPAVPQAEPAQPEIASPTDSPPPAPDSAEPRPKALMVSDAPPRGTARAVESGAAPPAGDARSLGRELFSRTWNPNDPRCHGGDGLGPVYNATSCVECHGLGGPGGAGPSGMNVQLISAVGDEITGEFGFRSNQITVGNRSDPRMLDLTRISERADLAFGIANLHLSTRPAGGRFRDGLVFSANGTTLKAHEFDLRLNLNGGDSVLSCAGGAITAKSFTLKPDEDAMRQIHAGLVAAPSAVIHYHGVDPGYKAWRSRLMAVIRASAVRSDRGLKIAGGRILASRRNAPPLFGLGLIDDLPDEVLVAAAERETPQIRGRVRRMKSGRIGRFGWKAQTTDLREFVLGACAGELGLEVPGHPQASSPLAPDLKARAMDLTPKECDALVAYVKALPAPIRLDYPSSPSIDGGRQAFEEIGCADCHRPTLGNIDGIYSDLLLHDMGPDLTSVTVQVYYGPPEKLDIPTAASMADGTEWRTPPLWGYRDSGPYLHDGRARNLVEAVRAHKGQAGDSAARFLHSPDQRQSLIERFLKSLAAPAHAEPTVIADAEAPSGRRGSLARPPASPPPVPRGTRLTRAEAVEQAEQERIEAMAPADQERRAASRLKLAESLEKMGKPQGALEFYREIIRDEPDTEAARIAAERFKALGRKVAARKGP